MEKIVIVALLMVASIVAMCGGAAGVITSEAGTATRYWSFTTTFSGMIAYVFLLCYTIKLHKTRQKAPQIMTP